MGGQEEPEALCEGDCEVQDARIAARGVPARGDSNNRVCNRVLHRICHRIYSNNGPQDERTDQSWIDRYPRGGGRNAQKNRRWSSWYCGWGV